MTALDSILADIDKGDLPSPEGSSTIEIPQYWWDVAMWLLAEYQWQADAAKGGPRDPSQRRPAAKAGDPGEEWRPIPGYQAYEASSHGRVRSVDRVVPAGPGGKGRHAVKGVILSQRETPKGHLHVKLYQDNMGRAVGVHRLVCHAFHGDPPTPKHQAAHRDGNPKNNHYDNLYWATQSQNLLDSVRHGTHWFAKRTHCNYGHEFTEENTYWRKGTNSRACRACARARAPYYNARRSRRKKEAATG